MTEKKPRKRLPNGGIYELVDRMSDANFKLEKQLESQREEYEERIKYLQSEIDYLKMTLAAQKKSIKPILDTIKRFTLGTKKDDN